MLQVGDAVGVGWGAGIDGLLMRFFWGGLRD